MLPVGWAREEGTLVHDESRKRRQGVVRYDFANIHVHLETGAYLEHQLERIQRRSTQLEIAALCMDVSGRNIQELRPNLADLLLTCGQLLPGCRDQLTQ